MTLNALTALSPLDGRYVNKLSDLRPLMSEFGLIRARVFVEVRWLIYLSELKTFTDLPALTAEARSVLDSILSDFSTQDAMAIKQLEETTRHDVKAVEYYLQEKLSSYPDLIPFVHFGCTSEDINNTAYALMLKTARDEIILPESDKIISKIQKKALEYAEIPMLSRTHGQSATPTTLGKEWANVFHRLKPQREHISSCAIAAKFNGAVGNYNAHLAAYPALDWPQINEAFIKGLGLDWRAYTTQIEPHDQIAQYLQALSRFNTILIDFCKDTWSYISLGYFSQQSAANEVGSSTMPHKVNPIDFENAEGNLGISNALGQHLANTLPMSRWQRDLTDSTVLRNLGVVIGHSLISYRSLMRGLGKLSPHHDRIHNDLNQHWEVLAEPIQTVMRAHGIADAYEQLKTFTRGRVITKDTIRSFIDQSALPDSAKKSLNKLRPDNYLGQAIQLTQEIRDTI